jgi:hypothetical protein
VLRLVSTTAKFSRSERSVALTCRNSEIGLPDPTSTVSDLRPLSSLQLRFYQGQTIHSDLSIDDTRLIHLTCLSAGRQTRRTSLFVGKLGQIEHGCKGGDRDVPI